jgi:hypothetical protein
LTALVVCCAASALAGSKSTTSTARTDASDALPAERQLADAADRRALLAAARTDSAAPDVWWQSGYVRRGDSWQPFEQVEPENAAPLKEYAARREQARLTAGDQLKLADWCRDAGLRDQERVHLIQALSTGQAPNPQALVRRLGYRQVGARWYTDADLKATQDELTRLGKEWKRLTPKLNPLATKLEGKPAMRSRGMADLRALTTRDALPILEFALAARSEAAAGAVVEAISDVDSYRASQSLARLAIGSPWEAVRGAATQTLKQRPWEDFVPMTLGMMHEPIEMKLIVGAATPNILNNPRGGREWRFLFAREGREAIEVAALRVIDCRFISVRPTDRLDYDSEQRLKSIETAKASLDEYYNWVESAHALNDHGELLNERIAAILHAVTGVQDSATPGQWWDWWDQTTDAPLSGPKSTIIVREDLRKIEAPVRLSCLAAGTLVRTENGFQPIETIRIGDRVLSKHIETGELKFAPVLQTTRRENAPLTNVIIGDETFAASAGHNFWISGRGWMRTNQLTDGMTAHTATGTATIRVEDAGRSADVFNLVVDDAHTYFVGQSLLLGHDVLIPPPTDIVIPGLSPEVAER